MDVGVCRHFLRSIVLPCEGRGQYSAQVRNDKYFTTFSTKKKTNTSRIYVHRFNLIAENTILFTLK